MGDRRGRDGCPMSGGGGMAGVGKMDPRRRMVNELGEGS